MKSEITPAISIKTCEKCEYFSYEVCAIKMKKVENNTQACKDFKRKKVQCRKNGWNQKDIDEFEAKEKTQKYINSLISSIQLAILKFAYSVIFILLILEILKLLGKI